MAELRTLVTFESAAFNTTEEKPEFINPGNFGEDVARWLMGELRAQGVPVGEAVGQEDFGWYFSYQVGGAPHCFVLGHREEEPGTGWLGWLERDAGFFGSLLGGRNRGLDPEAARVVHRALTGSDRIGKVRWHYRKDFECGNEEGSAEP